MAFLRSKSRDQEDIWPGFVDVLASLLMIIIFLLTFFFLAQYFLSEKISGQNSELEEFRSKISRLNDLLNLEKMASQDLGQKLKFAESHLGQKSSELTKIIKEKEEHQERSLTLACELDALKAKLGENTINQQKDADLILSLTNQVTHLSEELQRITKALALKEQESVKKEEVIKDLGEKLNIALLKKVEELESFRSEFFGKLKEILKHQKDILIEGDRFVLQSEVLFPSGSAILNPEGSEELTRLATIFKEVMAKIPNNLPWILRIDGHTDRLPFKMNLDFKSNWELSTARALSVLHFLVKLGIPPERLAATGFGEHHPIDSRQSEEAYQKNRRIEFKLTNR